MAERELENSHSNIWSWEHGSVPDQFLNTGNNLFFQKAKETISTVWPQQSAHSCYPVAQQPPPMSGGQTQRRIRRTKFPSSAITDDDVVLSTGYWYHESSFPPENSHDSPVNRCLRSGDVLSQSPLSLYLSLSPPFSPSLSISVALSDIPRDHTVNRALISREERRGIKSWTDVYPRRRLARAGQDHNNRRTTSANGGKRGMRERTRARARARA